MRMNGYLGYKSIKISGTTNNTRKIIVDSRAITRDFVTINIDMRPSACTWLVGEP